MIELSYSDINNSTMNGALTKLDECVSQDFPAKVMFDLNKLIGIWDKETRRAKRDFNKLIEKHSVKEPLTKPGKVKGETEPVLDKKGEQVMVPKRKVVGGQMAFEYHDQDAFDNDSKELLKQVFKVKCFKFQAEDFAKAGLTNKELRACAKIIENAPEEWHADTDDDDI